MKLSLRMNIIYSVAALAVGCAAIAGLGLHGVSRASDRLKEIVEVASARKDRWSEVRNLQAALALNEQTYIVDSRPEVRRAVASQMDIRHKSLDELLASLALSAAGEADDVSGKSEKAAVANFKKALYKWWEHDLEARREADQGRRDNALQISAGKGHELVESSLATASAMIEASGKDVTEAAQLAAAGSSAARLGVWGVFLLTLVISAVGMRALFATLGYCTNMIAKTISDSSINVEKTARQVADAASKLSQASTEQASALQETAASAGELSAMVERNQENAKQATMLSNSSQTCAHKGQQVMQDMAKAIYEIHSSNQDVMNEVFESNRKISEITKVIAEIGQKTKIINDIVFQTKLLSFNASVEAARAGEHGRGFAIVAEEVGNLARMSGSAAKDIGDMLASSIQKVDAIVRETKTNVERLVLLGKEKVDAGTRIVGECSAVLDEIVTSITQVSVMSNDISSASDEQAYGVKEISTAVGQLDAVVHGNAVSAEEAARAADGLSSQAKALQTTVNELLGQLQGGLGEIEKPNGFFDAQAGTLAAHWPKKRPETDDPAQSAAEKKPSRAAKQAGASEKKSNVVELKSAKAGPASQSATGAENEIPSADDPRFKDI